MSTAIVPSRTNHPQKGSVQFPKYEDRTKVITGWVYGHVYLGAGIMGESHSESDVDKQEDPSAKTSARTVKANSETLKGTQLQHTLSTMHKTMLELLAKKLETPAPSDVRASCDMPAQKGSRQSKRPRLRTVGSRRGRLPPQRDLNGMSKNVEN